MLYRVKEGNNILKAMVESKGNQMDEGGLLPVEAPKKPELNVPLGTFNRPTVDPVTVDAMRAAGFYGTPTDIKFDATVQPDKLGYIGSQKRDTGNYSMSTNNFADYNKEYMPWFERNYGDGKNPEQMLAWLDPNSPEWQSRTPEQQAKAYQNLGELYRKGYDTKDPNVVRSLLTDAKPGPATSLIDFNPEVMHTMKPITPNIPTTPPDTKLTIKPITPGTPEEPLS